MTHILSTDEILTLRHQCLQRAFTGINRSFADWYQATQQEIEIMEVETMQRLHEDPL
ncbi:MAG: hypothetical protein IKO35_04715 [Elusimicrobiaceae bacterium]|nr:hypothetical protein [Elusimicrobiaceae bacterium]